jgi:hypothetical protein
VLARPGAWWACSCAGKAWGLVGLYLCWLGLGPSRSVPVLARPGAKQVCTCAGKAKVPQDDHTAVAGLLYCTESYREFVNNVHSAHCKKLFCCQAILSTTKNIKFNMKHLQTKSLPTYPKISLIYKDTSAKRFLKLFTVYAIFRLANPHARLR